MKGDFTRFSHQPHRHYAGVLMQQGRVTLDADWNEQFDIDDHRWRMQTIDTIGRACAPVGNAGFGLSLTPDGTDVIISPGRIYIEGILVENHEGSAVGVDEVGPDFLKVRDLGPDGRMFEDGHWVEVSSDDSPGVVVTRVVDVDPDECRIEVVDDVSGFDGDDGVVVTRLTTYLTQPFYPADEPEPFGEPFTPEDWANLSHLFYLDVWRRHVTAIEDPHIREVALGGPDTATRVQTMWAVRIVREPEEQGQPADASGIGCTDDLDAWDALIAPAAGRLSAFAAAAPDPEDPCAILPDAGYRGLENRLYRVEVHEPGDLGAATFKWSRDNGSILSAIVDFPDADVVDVHSLGKDKVLRFSADNRVEVLSDESQFASLPGTMASIVGDPDEAERRISLDTDVSVYEQHTLPRIRRWDNGDDEILTQPGPIELEDGVKVEFSAGPFRSGDYWVIPARTATGDVEGFIDAPPRGIEHHRTRLAIVKWPGAAAVDIVDCRLTFPPLCEIEPGGGHACCSVSVGEGGDFATLPGAVEFAETIEGPVRICVLPGEHRLVGPVTIGRGDLTIVGCGRRSRIVSLRAGALVFDDVTDVRLEDLWVFSGSLEPTVLFINSRTIEMVDCRIVNVGRAEIDVVDLLSATHGFGHTPNPEPIDDIFGDESTFAAIEADSFRAFSVVVPRSLGPAVSLADCQFVRMQNSGFRGLPALDLQGEHIWVEQNVVTGGGIWLRDGTDTVAIAHNTITRGHTQGILLGGLRDGEDLVVSRSGVRAVDIVDNEISVMAREGISTLVFGGERVGDVEEISIQGNTITQCGIAPIVEGLALGGGIFIRDGADILIHDNTIIENGPFENSEERFAIGFGVAVVMCVGLDVQDNRIADNGRAVGPGDEGINLNVGIAGLGVFSAQRGFDDAPELDGPAAVVHGNVIGVAEGPGVFMFGLGPISIDDNEITCRYPGRGLIDYGRAVMAINMGAAPDIGVAQIAGKEVSWPFLHGRISAVGNQISVQGRAYGLPPWDPEFNSVTSPVAQSRLGSAVALYSFDDVLIDGNQIVNEMRPAGDGRGRIRSSVWASASTIRTTTNRLTELPFTALHSYVGNGAAHNASDNISTHCVRVEGTNTVNRDNIEIFCLRLVPIPVPIRFHAFIGG